MKHSASSNNPKYNEEFFCFRSSRQSCFGMSVAYSNCKQRGSYKESLLEKKMLSVLRNKTCRTILQPSKFCKRIEQLPEITLPFAPISTGIAWNRQHWYFIHWWWEAERKKSDKKKEERQHQTPWVVLCCSSCRCRDKQHFVHLAVTANIIPYSPNPLLVREVILPFQLWHLHCALPN